MNKKINWFGNTSPLFKPVKLPTKKSIRGIPKKDLTWPQAVIRYPKVTMFGDVDRDGKLNMFDCKPFDKKRHSLIYKKKTYPDTVLTKTSYRKNKKTGHGDFKKMRKVNLDISEKDLDKTAAYYNTVEKIMPGTMEYLDKSGTIVEIGEQDNAFVGAAYLPQSKTRKRGRLYITPPRSKSFANVRAPWTREKQAAYEVKSGVKTFAHEMGHVKRDIEMGKKGVPVGERFESGGWNKRNFVEESVDEDGNTVRTFGGADAEGYEEEAEKYKRRIERRVNRMDKAPVEILKEEEVSVRKEEDEEFEERRVIRRMKKAQLREDEYE